MSWCIPVLPGHRKVHLYLLNSFFSDTRLSTIFITYYGIFHEIMANLKYLLFLVINFLCRVASLYLQTKIDYRLYFNFYTKTSTSNFRIHSFSHLVSIPSSPLPVFLIIDRSATAIKSKSLGSQEVREVGRPSPLYHKTKGCSSVQRRPKLIIHCRSKAVVLS
jgi:hypothetical protein